MKAAPLNDVPPQGVQPLETLLAQNRGKTVALLVRRGEQKLSVPLPLASAK